MLAVRLSMFNESVLLNWLRENRAWKQRQLMVCTPRFNDRKGISVHARNLAAVCCRQLRCWSLESISSVLSHWVSALPRTSSSGGYGS